MLLGTGLLSVMLGGVAWAQETTSAPADRGGRGGRSPEEMQRRMAEGQARMLEQARQQLGFSEQEWQLVKPRFEKVAELSRQGAGPMRGMGMGMGGRDRGDRGRGRGADDGQQQDRPQGPARPEDQSEMGKAREKLREVSANQASTPDQIKSALADYRTAQANHQKQLDEARKNLRELLTARQEAMLVASDMMD